MLSSTADDLTVIVVSQVLIRSLAERHSGGELWDEKPEPCYFLT